MGSDLAYIESSWRKFEKNEKHVTRIYDQNVLIFMFSGILKFSEDGKDIALESGEYYIQKKNLFQEGKVASDMPEYFFIHFKGDYDNMKYDIPLRGNFDKDSLSQIFDSMVNPLSSSYKQQALFFEALDMISTSYTDINSLPTKIKVYIDTHYAENCSHIVLSDIFSYSDRYIEKVFKDSFGISVHKYIRKKRIAKAKLMLKTGNQSAESIAVACGYAEFSTFYRNFIAEEGLPPLKWRKHATSR